MIDTSSKPREELIYKNSHKKSKRRQLAHQSRTEDRNLDMGNRHPEYNQLPLDPKGHLVRIRDRQQVEQERNEPFYRQNQYYGDTGSRAYKRQKEMEERMSDPFDGFKLPNLGNT